MKFNNDLFCKERDVTFNSSINTIYKFMFRKDLYETREENEVIISLLMYFINMKEDIG